MTDDLDRYDDLHTSLTIETLRVRDVGRVLAILQDAGFLVEINLGVVADAEPTPIDNQTGEQT